MHGSAQTAVEAGGTCEYLCQCAVEQEVDGQVANVALLLLSAFYNLQDGTAEEFLHDVIQLFLRQLVNGGQTLCDDLAVATVRTEGEVVDVQAVSLTNGGSFLTDGQMCRAGVVVLDAVVFALDLDVVEHGLELTDDSHIAIDAEEIILGVNFLFLSKSFLVLANRDIIERDKAGLENFAGIHVLTLRHNVYSLYKL